MVNTVRVTDRTGTNKLEIVDTRPECSCVLTNTHTMTLTVYLTQAYLQVAAANLQVRTSTLHQSTGSSIRNFLHQSSTNYWPTGMQSNGKLFTMACNESYTCQVNLDKSDNHPKSYYHTQTHQAVASSSFSDKLLITQLKTSATQTQIWKDFIILMEFR